MGYPLLAMLTLPYSRMELPGWGRLLTAAGVFDDPRWAAAPNRMIRGKLHGYRMRLCLASWSERQTYFLGRYYDLKTQMFLQAALRPGETLIDVGGNIGMMTLLGARLVGETGRVVTFEPNPDACQRIREATADNGIAHVTLLPLAVSDQPGRMTLSVITNHTGMGTLAPVDASQQALVSARHEVEVVRGDDVLPDDLPAPVTIKFDIEGFECRAIHGLEKTIRRYRPVIVTEVADHHLRRAGHSARELCELLQGVGYRGYLMGLQRHLLGQRLVLGTLPEVHQTVEEDVAWVFPGSEHESRLAPYVEA